MQTYDCRLVGVISDTHGVLRPNAVRALHGVELILHAGDVGDEDILTELELTAPVLAVRGNCDAGPWAEQLPLQRMFKLRSKSVVMRHILEAYQADPVVGVDVVITGHTHKPRMVEENGTLYLNPGSAGPKRFSLPISVAILEFKGAEMSVRQVEIE